MTQRFAVASWPTSLKVVSFLGTITMFAVFFIGRRTLPADPIGRTLKPLMAYVPFVIVGWALLFVITGYDVDRTEIRVRRLLWSTTFPLQGLTRAWFDPEAMRGSIRVFGNGGLFSFSGVFQSKALGRYRAFVTDPRSSVVLVLLERTILVTPAEPQAFVDYVRHLFPSVRGRE